MKIKNLLKRIVPIICILSFILLNSVVVFAASNQNYSIDQSKIQHYSLSDRFGFRDNVEIYSLPVQQLGFYVVSKRTSLYQTHLAPSYIYHVGKQSYLEQISPRYVSSMGEEEFWRYDFDVSCFDNGYFLDLTGLDDNSKIFLDLRFQYLVQSGNVRSFITPTCDKVSISYYDANGVYISTQNSTNVDTFVHTDGISVSSSITLTRPIGAKYCSLSLNIVNFGIASDEVCTLNFRLVNFLAYLGLPSSIIPQNFKEIAITNSQHGLYRDWFIEPSPQYVSTYLTSNDPALPAFSGAFNEIEFYAKTGSNYDYRPRFRFFYPNRFLKLDNLPVGTQINVPFWYIITSQQDFKYPYIQIQIVYFDSEYNQITNAAQHVYFNDSYTKNENNDGGEMEAQFVLDYPENAKYLCIYVNFQNLYFFGDNDYFPVNIKYDFFSVIVKEYVGTLEFPTGDEFNDLSGFLELDRPNINGVNTNIAGLVDMNVFLAFSNTVSAFWESPLLVGILTALVTLLLISWVFFGQKG